MQTKDMRWRGEISYVCVICDGHEADARDYKRRVRMAPTTE